MITITQDQLRDYIALKSMRLKDLTEKEVLSIPAFMKDKCFKELELLRAKLLNT